MSATKPAHHFEAIKYSLRQSKDGVVVAFVVQPEDVRPELMALAVGARVMVAWSEIGDDEKPVGRAANGSAADGNDSAAEAMDETAHRSGSGSSPERPAKPKRRFDELSLPAQCAIRCDDGSFKRFLSTRPGAYVEEVDHSVPEFVRGLLGVESRSELTTNHAAANKWRAIEAEYQRYLTDLEYGDSAR